MPTYKNPNSEDRKDIETELHRLHNSDKELEKKNEKKSQIPEKNKYSGKIEEMSGVGGAGGFNAPIGNTGGGTCAECDNAINGQSFNSPKGKVCHGCAENQFHQQELQEAWDESAKVKKLGKYGKKEHTIKSIKKEIAELRAKKKRTPEQTKKLRQLNFAARSREGWGKVNEHINEHSAIQTIIKKVIAEEFRKLARYDDSRDLNNKRFPPVGEPPIPMKPKDYYHLTEVDFEDLYNNVQKRIEQESESILPIGKMDAKQKDGWDIQSQDKKSRA